MSDVKCLENEEARVYKIKLLGLGGQGVVTAAEIFSHAVSIHEDRYARTIPAYGHERRGAPVFSDVMMDDRPILLGSFVYDPDFVVVFSPSMMDRGVDLVRESSKETVLVVNSENESLLRRIKGECTFTKIYHVGATRIALEQTDKDIPNGPMLGALARTGIVGIDSIGKSLREYFKNKQGEENVRAAEEAYRHAGEI